jgi:hypothetical protein
MINKESMNLIKDNYLKLPNKVFDLKLPAACIGMYSYFLSCSESFNPSVRQCCKVLGITRNTYYKHLDILLQCNVIKVVSQGHGCCFGLKSKVAVYEFRPRKEWVKFSKTKNVGVSEKTP